MQWKIFITIKDFITKRKYLNQIKQKKGKSLVNEAYTYDRSQAQNRLSIESSAIKLNDNLKTLLNKEIDI